MTELPPTPEVGSRNDIDTASVGLVTLDTASPSITSCNDAFAEVIGRAANDLQGAPVTDFVGDGVKSIAMGVMEGIRAGYISSADGNVDVLRATGSVRVDCFIRPAGMQRPHETAMAAVVPVDRASPAGKSSVAGFRPSHLDPNRMVLATVDRDGRIIELAAGSASRLGLPEPDGTTAPARLQHLMHPADASVLAGSFGRGASRSTPQTVTLRLRGADDQWLSARVTLSALRGQGAPSFGLVMWLAQGDEPDGTESRRLARLEGQLARIRQVVQATGADGAAGSVNLRALTTRQREIVERLLDGHRVDAIARDLYVSPSTVRNHLSAIFEKLGVASQSELVELLRGHVTGDKDPD